jgi:hypothetical protein
MNVCFGSQAASQSDISLMSAIGGKAAGQQTEELPKLRFEELVSKGCRVHKEGGQYPSISLMFFHSGDRIEP